MDGKQALDLGHIGMQGVATEGHGQHEAVDYSVERSHRWARFQQRLGTATRQGPDKVQARPILRPPMALIVHRLPRV